MALISLLDGIGSFMNRVYKIIYNQVFKSFLINNKKFILLFIMLLSIDIAFNNYSYFSGLKLFFYWDFNGQVKYLLYLLNYVIQILIILLLLTSKNRALRHSSYIVLFLTFSIFLTYFFINGYGFTSNEAMVAISDFSFAKEAFKNFSTSIYKAVGFSTLLLIAICFFIGKTYNNIRTNILIMTFSTLMVLYVFVGTSSAADRLFFVPYKVIFNYYNAYKSPMFFGKKQTLQRISGASKVDKIVYVVDESIVGNKLSINGFEKNTTPFLKSIEHEIYNYGVASSAANCSSISNTILRSGIMPNMLPDKEQASLRNANIWAYAKKAGYYTVFIDAQNKKNKPHNFMTKYDFATIDKYIQIEKYSLPNRYMNDFKLIDILKEELVKHEKIFVYINKLGAHFPYEETYPEKNKFFLPTLRDGEAPSLEKKEKMLNSYFNSIRWSVDLWWEKVYSQIKNLDVLFLYTSDHGQNLFDNSSKATHCSINPISSEANVPIFLFPFGETKAIVEGYAGDNLFSNIDHASHFNIFPTILFLEGYVLKDNEISLFEALSQQKRLFYSGDIWGRTNFKKNIFDESNIK